MPERPVIPNEDLPLMEVQVAELLEGTKHLAANAVSSGNSGYFLLRADQWFLLAALRWRLKRPNSPLAQALKEFLIQSLTAIELGAMRPAPFSHALWSVALVLGDVQTAHFIASWPEAVLGLPAAPETVRIVAETRIGFALLRGDLKFATRLLEVFEGLCFDTDPAELTTIELQRARRIYPVLVAIRSGNSGGFNQSMNELLDSHHSDGRRLTVEFADRVSALGLIRLARLLGLAVELGAERPDLPQALLGTDSPETRRRPA
jgi:hypothetical protein